LVLRMELYRDEYPDLAEEIEEELGVESEIHPAQGQGNAVPHRNAVESQAGKKASLGRKKRKRNWIDQVA
jgi:hypothetical protein